jgi:hypothetical protein
MKKPREVPPWFWGVLGVLVFAWFAYWIGRGK